MHVHTGMFSRYPPIENQGAKVEGGEPGDIWAASPKYHGTNTQVLIPRDATQEVAYGRRGGLLAPGEAHYGYQTLLPTLADWTSLRDAWPDDEELETIIVYGELYGGNYPHPDVPPTSAPKVQPSVYYSPHLRFIAFDLAKKNKDGTLNFLSLYDAITVFDRCQIPRVTLPFRGLREEVVEWAKAHAEDNPQEWMVGGSEDKTLPRLDDNIGEGFVVRPVMERLDRLGNRCMLKVKSPRFSEIKNVSKAGKPKADLGDRPGGETAQTYLNAARCGSVCSKVPQADLSIKNMKVLASALIEDALKDVPSDDPVRAKGAPEAKTFRSLAFQTMATYLRSL
jgi:Rnl2 family RNA ligase